MRLFEAIVDANHRAVAGDPSAGLRPGDFPEELPVIALTCVDPRLNALFPSALGLPGDQFIWLRNAGNIITGPLSSTMRSLALACAVKGGREIAIIGHTDCQVCKVTTMQLLDRLKAQGIERHALPENLSEFFGTSGSERQTVLKGVDFARNSPLIGRNVPVHGFLVDVTTGKLEWLVNGYQQQQTTSRRSDERSSGRDDDSLFKSMPKFEIGDMRFPDVKIGESAGPVSSPPPPPAPETQTPPPAPPPIPPHPKRPPPIAARLRWNRPK